MPNHIKNRLILSGTIPDVTKCIEMYSTFYPSEPDKSYDDRIIYENKKTNEYGYLNPKTGEFETKSLGIIITIPDDFKICMTTAWTRFPDFEKIIRMPDQLHTKLHSGIECAIENALKMDFSENELLRGLEMLNRQKTESPLKLSDEDWDKFIVGLNNVRKYGFISWYGWSIENWGTKWNAYSCEKIEDNVFQFETAWSSVPKLINEMSLKNPAISISYEWADEDTGSNCGYANYFKGEVELVELKNQSNEAYEMYFKLHPGDIDHYKLVNGKYKYIEE